MINDKRGISPIISTVLLIAFTVTLFLLISAWIRGSIVDESLESTEQQLAGQLDCLSASVKISNVAVKSTGNEIKLNVDNTGNVDIKGLTIRVMNTGSGTLAKIDYTAASPVAPLGRVLTSSTLNAINPVVSGANRVEVYPVLDGGNCNDQFDSTTNVGSY